MLLLHKPDGTVRVRCEGCNELYKPGLREQKALEAHGERYAAICDPCIAAANRYRIWVDQQREARAAQ